ncbi:MAG: MFS transporter [Chloroflexota bacterium]
MVVVGALVAFCSGPGQSFVFSIFLDSIIEDTGLDRTTVSALYTVGTGISAIMVATVSRLADRFGPRVMLGVMAFFLGVACFSMAAATGFVAFFLAFAALRALGQGSLPINATLLTATWFVARRGRAMAMMGLGFSLSSAILPPIVRVLITNIGWREAYVVLGVMVWILLIPAAIFLVRNKPEDVGLHPDGFPHPPENEPDEVPRDTRGRDTRPVFSSLNFWLLAIPLATPSLVSTALVFHQTSLFADRGISAGVAAAVFPVLALASAITSVVAGFIVDRIGPRKLFASNMLVLLLGTVLVGVISTPLAAFGYAALIGAAEGSWRVVNGVTWAHIYGRHGLGRIQGSAVMVGISAAAIGPLPLAWMRDVSGGYPAGLALLSALCLFAMVAIFLARPERESGREPATQST